MGKKIEIEYELYDFEGLDISYDTSLVKLHPDIEWKSIWTSSYQGDVISIGVDKKGFWYYKNNSYGSCSGCDWVSGINNKEEAEKFLKNQEQLDEVGTKEEIKEYLKKEQKNVYDFSDENLKELLDFIDLK